MVGGMPLLTADLEYQRDVPLFVTGTYAGLQIGPAAGNLGGMRDSSDRIANRLLELLTPPTSGSSSRLSGSTSSANKATRSRGSSETKEAYPGEGKREKNDVESITSRFTHFSFDILSIEA